MLLFVAAVVLWLVLAQPLPFFGQQAVRLLREKWGGPTETGAKQLSEELYAMLDDSIPQVQNGPVTVNKLGDGGGMTINNPIGGNSLSVNGGDTSFGGDTFTTNTKTTNIGGGTVNLGNTDLSSHVNINGDTISLKGGDVTIKGGTVTISGDDVKIIRTGGGPPDPTSPGSVATTVFLGQVVSGSGGSYLVAIYGKGSGSAATATVSATVPQIDPGETIPAGTWVGAVHKFVVVDDEGKVTATTHEFQPPVWMAAS